MDIRLLFRVYRSNEQITVSIVPQQGCMGFVIPPHPRPLTVHGKEIGSALLVGVISICCQCQGLRDTESISGNFNPNALQESWVSPDTNRTWFYLNNWSVVGELSDTVFLFGDARPTHATLYNVRTATVVQSFAVIPDNIHFSEFERNNLAERDDPSCRRRRYRHRPVVPFCSC